MYKDIIDIISFSSGVGIFTIMCSNGTLMNKEISEKIVESGLNIISLSLDGINEKTHDTLRGEGSYKKVIDAFGYFKNRLRISINTVVMNHNIDELGGLVDFAERNKVWIRFQGLNWQSNAYTNFLKAQDNELWPKDIIKVEKALDELIARKKKHQRISNSLRHLKAIRYYYRWPGKNMNYRCQVRKNMYIRPNGSVKYCSPLEEIGNVTIEEPEKIWESEKALYVRTKINKCPANCTYYSCSFHENLLEKMSHFKDVVHCYFKNLGN